MIKRTWLRIGTGPLAAVCLFTTFVLTLLCLSRAVHAQQGSGNPPAGLENTNCTATTNTNCLVAGSVTITNLSMNPTNGCVGDTFSASAANNTIQGSNTVTITYSGGTNCPSNTTTTNPTSPTIISNWWVISGVSVKGKSTDSGLSTGNFIPTTCGTGTVTFYVKYSNSPPCGGGIQQASASTNFTVHSTTITMFDNPKRTFDHWPCSWAATLQAVCVPGTNNTTTSYSTANTALASIAYGFSVDVHGNVTTSGPTGAGSSGDIGKIVVPEFSPGQITQGGQVIAAGVHIKATFTGCCDGQLNWVQTITTDTSPVVPGTPVPRFDTAVPPSPPSQSPYYYAWPPGNGSWPPAALIPNHTTTCP